MAKFELFRHDDAFLTRGSVVKYITFSEDGDTVIYQNTYEGGEPPFFHELQEAACITPKAGTLVVFDGRHWHTAQQPQEGVRAIININIKK